MVKALKKLNRMNEKDFFRDGEDVTGYLRHKCSWRIKCARSCKIFIIIITPFREPVIRWAPPNIFIIMIRPTTATCCLPLVIRMTSFSIGLCSPSPGCTASWWTTYRTIWKPSDSDSHCSLCNMYSYNLQVCAVSFSVLQAGRQLTLEPQQVMNM